MVKDGLLERHGGSRAEKELGARCMLAAAHMIGQQGSM